LADQYPFTPKPKVAASSYLNTAPLIWSFQYGSQRDAVELITHAAPARCAAMLAAGDVDAALVPVIEYQRMADVEIVPGVCVGSHDAVRSVVIASKPRRLEEVRSVALDQFSRTSQALVRIIFKEFVGFEPTWQACRPDVDAMLAENDAALIIGDPAMQISREDVSVFDLATLWHNYTDTGFVFAMWMARPGTATNSIHFAKARDEGLANIDRIAAEDEDVPLSVSERKKYLTRNIAFSVDEQLESGMRLFFALAAKHKLIDQNKPLRFSTASP
jgi:chorismate dehydratase